MIIYKATSNTSGKSYIGATSRTIELRQKEHEKLANLNPKNKHFYYALLKYGYNDFDWCVLEEAETQELMYIKEKEYIKKFNTYSKGYNMTPGGEGGRSGKYSEDDRKRLYSNRKYNSDSTGKKSMYFLGINKCRFVDKKDIPYYLEQGWMMGSKKRSLKKHTCKLPPKKKYSTKPFLTGLNNPSGMIIEIYDNNHNLVVTSEGSLKNVCKKLGVPYGQIANSFKTGVPLYHNTKDNVMTRLKNNGNIKFKGWYAIKIQDKERK